MQIHMLKNYKPESIKELDRVEELMTPLLLLMKALFSLCSEQTKEHVQIILKIPTKNLIGSLMKTHKVELLITYQEVEE